MSKAETGITDDSAVVKVTVVHLLGGLTARMMGDQTTKLKTAKVWFKAKGISGNDLFIYAPDVRLMEVAEGTVQKSPTNPVPDVPAGEFRPVDLKLE